MLRWTVDPVERAPPIFALLDSRVRWINLPIYYMPSRGEYSMNVVGSRANGCIYCGKVRAFTNEHVIPAGLGAGDSLQLENLVCEKCNGEFSKLEVRILRQGDIGLGRLIFQERGRNRGRKSRPPKLEAASARLITEDGNALAVEIGFRLAPEVLPQVFKKENTLNCTGSDAPRLQNFLNTLDQVLQDKATLVCKSLSSREFNLWDLVLGPDGYFVEGSRSLEEPENGCIWIEQSPVSDDCLRILERSRGGIVVQVPDGSLEAAVDFLSLIKKNLSNLVSSIAGQAEQSFHNPLIHVAAQLPPEREVALLLGKIGFNILIHAWGEELGRNACFDSLCKSILTGSDEIRFTVWDSDLPVATWLKSIFRQQHWMMLVPVLNPNGKYSIIFGGCFFGATVRSILLLDEMPPGFLVEQVYYSVDYRKNSVRKYTLFDVLTEFQTQHSAQVGN